MTYSHVYDHRHFGRHQRRISVVPGLNVKRQAVHTGVSTDRLGQPDQTRLVVDLELGHVFDDVVRNLRQSTGIQQC